MRGPWPIGGRGGCRVKKNTRYNTEEKKTHTCFSRRPSFVHVLLLVHCAERVLVMRNCHVITENYTKPTQLCVIRKQIKWRAKTSSVVHLIRGNTTFRPAVSFCLASQVCRRIFSWQRLRIFTVWVCCCIQCLSLNVQLSALCTAHTF